MRLTKRAVQALWWWDIQGVHPLKFKEGDKFCLSTGDVVGLEDAPPHGSVWIPDLDALMGLLKLYFGLDLRVVKSGDLVMLSAEYKGHRVEGAGKSDVDSTISFLERLRDAYSERVLEPD